MKEHMTTADMQEAIRLLRKTPAQEVYAARKGIVVATKMKDLHFIAFRRVNGVLQAERWGPASWGNKHEVASVPPELAVAVAKVIDR